MTLFPAAPEFIGRTPSGHDTCRSWDEVERHVKAAAFLPGELPDQFVTRMLNELHGANLGRHSNHPGEVSRDVISMAGACVTVDERRIDFQSADIVGGSTGPNPTPTFQIVTDYRPEATFVPWTPSPMTPAFAIGTDLGQLAVNGTGWTLDGRPWQWIGATAFDLPVRLAYGDTRFLDWLAASGFTIVRIAVFTLYRMPRWWDDGLRMLPRVLRAAGDRGLCVEVTMVPDSKDALMTKDEIRHVVSRTGEILADYGNAAGELFNEVDHGGQLDEIDDPDFLRELRDLVPSKVPISWGSSDGGAPPKYTGGDYITHHADRSKSPEENGTIMKAAQDAHGKPVVDDEPKGIDEQPREDSRHADPEICARQGEVAHDLALGGSTFHSEAGLSATWPFLGPIQRDGAIRFVNEITLF